MFTRSTIFTVTFLFVLILLSAPLANAQNASNTDAVLWEPVSASRLDLFAGPGGDAMRPDLSKITFLKEETDGHSKKYRIKDGRGREWVAKIGSEAQPETAAVRLLYGLGYKTEINYLVRSITIPGKGTYENVRLEARPRTVEREDEWKWSDNPFDGTRELQGLKIMMAFMTNWDTGDWQNKVIEVKTGKGTETQYIISDLGRTFGKYGNNNLPVIYRLGRQTGSPKHWSQAGFIRRVRNGKIEFAVKGKNRGILKGITVEDGRWLADRLNLLTDAQIRDVFRAAGYTGADLNVYVNAARRRINELDQATSAARLARR